MLSVASRGQAAHGSLKATKVINKGTLAFPQATGKYPGLRKKITEKRPLTIPKAKNSRH